MNEARRKADEMLAYQREAFNREIVESKSLSGVSRESLFGMLANFESFPRWTYGLRRVRLGDREKGAGLTRRGADAGLPHRVQSSAPRE